MNEFTIIGKVLGELDTKISSNGSTFAQMFVSVKRPYKNKNGEYEEDIIKMILFKTAYDAAKDIVEDGKKILIKGHIGSSNYQRDNQIIYNATIIADVIKEI